MKKTPVIITALLALALVCVASVLGVRMKRQLTAQADTGRETAEAGFTAEEESISFFENTESGITSAFPDFITETTQGTTVFSAGLTSAPAPSVTEIPATVPAETASATQAPETSATAAQTTVIEKITSVTAAVNTAFQEAFSMPRVPKYVPTESKVDFDKASLASYKYYPDGDYYYTDDKNAWQKGFGYNQVYDSLAIASWMYYDTVRTTFDFEGKNWLIQIWKGQYGYYFVGEEIGVYTKEKSSGSQYVCADKTDWLKMEMCFVWDENHDGNYKPRFIRPYNDYWWCTGFVIGMESAASMRSRDQFRMIAHITFKSTKMAELFANAFEANGFRRVAKLDNNVKDTFVQIGPDVAFVWQSINQHKI